MNPARGSGGRQRMGGGLTRAGTVARPESPNSKKSSSSAEQSEGEGSSLAGKQLRQSPTRGISEKNQSGATPAEKEDAPGNLGPTSPKTPRDMRRRQSLSAKESGSSPGSAASGTSAEKSPGGDHS